MTRHGGRQIRWGPGAGHGEQADDSQQKPHAGGLARDAQPRRDLGRCALEHVRAPVVHRHSGDLEDDPDAECRQPQPEDGIRNADVRDGCKGRDGGAQLGVPGIQGAGDDGQVERAEPAVEQRHAVNHDGGRGGAEHDVLEGGFGAEARALVAGDEGVARQRGGLDRDDEHQQVERADHQHHAQRAGEQEDEELGSAALRGRIRAVPLLDADQPQPRDQPQRQEQQQLVENAEAVGQQHRRGAGGRRDHPGLRTVGDLRRNRPGRDEPDKAAEHRDQRRHLGAAADEERDNQDRDDRADQNELGAEQMQLVSRRQPGVWGWYIHRQSNYLNNAVI